MNFFETILVRKFVQLYPDLEGMYLGTNHSSMLGSHLPPEVDVILVKLCFVDSIANTRILESSKRVLWTAVHQ